MWLRKAVLSSKFVSGNPEGIQCSSWKDGDSEKSRLLFSHIFVNIYEV